MYVGLSARRQRTLAPSSISYGLDVFSLSTGLTSGKKTRTHKDAVPRPEANQPRR